MSEGERPRVLRLAVAVGESTSHSTCRNWMIYLFLHTLLSPVVVTARVSY
jgi:hypothetical protein